MIAVKICQIDGKNINELERQLLTQISEKYFNKNVENLEIIKTKNGKPHYKNNELFFNFSHSNNLVAVGVSNNEIGIDIQHIKNIYTNNVENLKINKKTLKNTQKTPQICEKCVKTTKKHNLILNKSAKKLSKRYFNLRQKINLFWSLNKQKTYIKYWTQTEAKIKLFGGSIYTYKNIKNNKVFNFSKHIKLQDLSEYFLSVCSIKKDKIFVE